MNAGFSVRSTHAEATYDERAAEDDDRTADVSAKPKPTTMMVISAVLLTVALGLWCRRCRMNQRRRRHRPNYNCALFAIRTNASSVTTLTIRAWI